MTETQHKPLIIVYQTPIGGPTAQAGLARELHGFLGVRKRFMDWKAQINRVRLAGSAGKPTQSPELSLASFSNDLASGTPDRQVRPLFLPDDPWRA